jgi:endonuclease YncB( thermonuclease family)
MTKRAFTVAMLANLLAFPALAVETTIPGPVRAQVVSVYDGDTLTVDAEPWPGVTIRTGVRVNGIDTPEIRGRCDEEKALAIQARDRVRELADLTVELRGVHFGKYAGRVVADVYAGGERIGDVLIREGLAREYDGTGPRQPWC